MVQPTAHILNIAPKSIDLCRQIIISKFASAKLPINALTPTIQPAFTYCAHVIVTGRYFANFIQILNQNGRVRIVYVGDWDAKDSIDITAHHVHEPLQSQQSCVMRSTHYLFYKGREHNFSKSCERLIMIFFARSCLPKFVRTYAVKFIHFHYLNLTMFIYLIINLQNYIIYNLTAFMNNNTEKKKKENSKSLVHQIINLDDNSNWAPSLDQELFVADLAYQCGNLLNWVADPNSLHFCENMWKNSMRVKASQKFPDLDPDQIRKLIDRDWRVMNEQKKRQISSHYIRVHNAGTLQSRAQSLRERIQNAKSKRKIV